MAVAISAASLGAAQSSALPAGVTLEPLSTDGGSPSVKAILSSEGLKAHLPCSSSEIAGQAMPAMDEFSLVRAIALDCQRHDGARFMVIVSAFSDHAAARTRFDEARQGVAGDAMGGDFSFKGHDARDFVMRTDRKCGWTRVVATDLQVVILGAERMSGDCKSLKAESTSLFESLEFSA